MTKEEFLKQLENNLSSVNDEDKKQILEYYDQMICDGVENDKSEESVISQFDSPKEIADKIIGSDILNSNNKLAVSNSLSNCESSNKKINQIVVDAVNICVHIIRGMSEKIICNYKISFNEVLEYSEENGVFYVKHDIKHHILSCLGFWAPNRNITIEVPSDFKGDIIITTSNAQVSVNSINNIGLEKIKTSNAKIEIYNASVQNLDLKTSNALIHVDNINGNKFTAVTSNGKVMMNNNIFKSQCYIKTSNATIITEKLTSDDIDLKTSNGSVSGNIIGDAHDYSITSKTSNASSSLPLDWKFENVKKRLNVKTSNAKIKIDFISL